MKVKQHGKRVLTVEHGPYMINDNPSAATAEWQQE
jgi:hypothetical protein